MAVPAKTAEETKHSKFNKMHINLGLQVLFPDPGEPSSSKSTKKFALDIVAIPGLGANPEWTWKRDKVHWLRDDHMLPRRVQNARISVFQYQSQWFGKGAVDQRLQHVADQLLYFLELLRGHKNKTPIIFVSHCFGGIVLEQALLTSRRRENDFPSIFPWVAGCIFLGTPFRGTKTQSKAMALAGAAKLLGIGASSTLLQLLEKDSEVLTDIVRKFANLTRNAQIRVFCFFESEPSDITGVLRKGLPFKSQEVIVDEASATYDGVDCLRLESDHFNLNKYTSPKDGNFNAVANEIKTTVKKAASILKSRQYTGRQALISDRTHRALIDILGQGFSDPRAAANGSYTGLKGDEPSWIETNKDIFKKWREQQTSQLIWVHSKAGNGQGLIASSVIDSLRSKTKEEGEEDEDEDEDEDEKEEESIVASFFCDQSDENRRSLRSMLRLLIRQIIETNQDLAVKLLTDSEKTKSAGKQNFDMEALNKVSVLWDALQAMAKEASEGCIHIILCGIDQLSAESLEEFLQYMKELPDKGVRLGEGVKVSPIKWMLLSRSGRPNIKRALEAKAHEISLDDPKNAGYVSDALRTTISARVDDLELSAPLTYFVKRHIHSRAGDNYIYVSLVIQELKNAQASGMRKYSEFRALLESFPFGLTDMFEHIRKRVLSPTAESIEYTKEILRCRILARRAPTLRELAIMADLPEEDRENLGQLKEHVIRCGAFVELCGNKFNEDSMKVEWIDISAQEHLEKYAKEELALDTEQKSMQHGIIALRCLEYVCSITERRGVDEHTEKEAESEEDEDAEHHDEQRPISPHLANMQDGEHDDEGPPKTETAPTVTDNEEDDQAFDKDDALRYPVQYWLEHARLAPVDVIEEFRMHRPFWKDDSAARQEWWSFNYSMHIEPNQTNVSPLHVAAIGEFPAFVDYLLNHGWTNDIHIKDSLGLQPLYCACEVGNYEIVERLLRAGADVDFASHESNVTALWAAAAGGHIDIVECLLNKDADINAKSAEWGSVLYAACEQNRMPTIQLLLERKADVNLVGGSHYRALNIASWNGNEEAVRLLIEHGADIDPDEDYWYGSAVGTASRRGHAEIVKLLLSKGWSPDKPMKTYGSFLTCAATYGHLGVVRILLQKETGIKVLERALVAASQNGKTEVVKAILEKTPAVPHERAFMRAADYGRDEVLELLFRRGVAQDKLDDALYLSADHERQSTVKLLLDFGASPNAEGSPYGRALTASAYDGTTEIMKALIGKGADVNKRRGDFGCPLQAAAWAGKAGNVEMLLEHGALVNTEPIGKYGHALQAACETGDNATIQLLLEKRANVNAQGGEYGYAIIAAVEEGDSEVLEILLKYDADVNVKGGENNSPVIATAGSTLSKEDLKLLLDRGADVNAVCDEGITALMNCADVGDSEGVEYLLSRGADVNISSKGFGTALHAAAEDGAEECCKILLKAGADVNAVGGLTGTPLQAAASVPDLDTVRVLLAAGANATGEGFIAGTYGTPLQAACSSGDLSVVRELVEHGALINLQPANGKHGFPLHAAAAAGDQEIVEYLLEKGADVALKGGEHGYALLAAAQRPWNHAVVQVLLDHGAMATVQGGLLGNAASAAAFANDSIALQMLIDAGADVHATGGKFGSCLQAATIRATDTACIDILLGLSVNVNFVGGKYRTALIAAAYFDREDVVSKLLKAGADPYIREEGKFLSAISAAAMRGNKGILEMFLKKDPPVQLLDEALVEACAYRQAASVELLFKYGANVHSKHATLGTAVDALETDQANGYNSDDENDDDEEEDDDDDEDDEDDEEEDGDDDDEDDEDDESESDGSVLDLQLEDEISEEVKIRGLLDKEIARVKRNPSLKRSRTTKRGGGLPTSLQAGPPPQMKLRTSYQQYNPTNSGESYGQQRLYQQQFSESPRQSFQPYTGRNQKEPAYPQPNHPPPSTAPYSPPYRGVAKGNPQQLPQQLYSSPSVSPSRKPVPSSYQQSPSKQSSPSTPLRQYSNDPRTAAPPPLPPRTESQEQSAQRYRTQPPIHPQLNPGSSGRYQQHQPHRQSYHTPQPAYAPPPLQQTYNAPPPQNSYASPPASTYNSPPMYNSPPPSQYQSPPPLNNQSFGSQPPGQDSGYVPYGQRSQSSLHTSFQSSQYTNSTQYTDSQQSMYGTPNPSQASGFPSQNQEQAQGPGQGQGQVPRQSGQRGRWATGGYDGEGYG